jgi:hypothetical protein
MEHDILKEFLKGNASEVLNMLLTEWNWDDAKTVWKEEGREEGREEGIEKAAENLLKYGMSPEQAAEALEIPLETVIGIQGRMQTPPG